MIMKRLYIVCCLLVALSTVGQENVSMFTVDVGYASIHDSYLTPITYSGTNLALGYEAIRPVRADKWLWQLQAGCDYNYAENTA